ncbi:hypothetical protein K490DRAFT_56073 [Saccharata proteae CBS 121410]|uniref:Uncharacterized protein n=1 Tax=Saccharata proteae CBS 121410 TaxID=1314787 RepID=A0A9P4I027_9PEZI|nr:hypothetical protein K490DRAFT_56073 [Saccharata proteae CBS 121410]
MTAKTTNRTAAGRMQGPVTRPSRGPEIGRPQHLNVQYIAFAPEARTPLSTRRRQRQQQQQQQRQQQQKRHARLGYTTNHEALSLRLQLLSDTRGQRRSGGQSSEIRHGGAPSIIIAREPVWRMLYPPPSRDQESIAVTRTVEEGGVLGWRQCRALAWCARGRAAQTSERNMGLECLWWRRWSWASDEDEDEDEDEEESAAAGAAERRASDCARMNSSQDDGVFKLLLLSLSSSGSALASSVLRSPCDPSVSQLIL